MPISRVTPGAAAAPSRAGTADRPDVRQAFQDFVGNTFFQQMLKSLRSAHGRPAYFHGGQAEEMFRSQLDQQVAEDLARDRGGPFADALFAAFAQRLRLAQSAPHDRAAVDGADSAGHAE